MVDRPNAGVGFDQVGREGAGAQHCQPVRVIAGQVIGGQGRRGGGAPHGQHFAVDKGQRLAGFAVQQHIAGHHRRQAARRIVGKDGDDLDANVLASLPRRHQQQIAGRPAAKGGGQAVMVAHRCRAAGTKHGAKTVD